MIVLATMSLASMTIQVPVFAQHSSHEEYDDDYYSSEDDKLRINYKIITPAIKGHLSVCVVAPGFEFCREYSNIGDRIVIGDMTTGVYHIPEGDNFEMCADLYPNDNDKNYHSCVDMKNHENDHPEYAVITLTKSSC